MNFGLQESLFRLVLPGCIFFLGIFVFDNDVATNLLKEINPVVATIGFVAVSYLISTIGAMVIECIYKFNGFTAEKEFGVWKSSEKRGEFIREKMARRWNYFATNINSLVSIGLIFIYFIIQLFFTDINTVLLIVVVSFVIFFYFLSRKHYSDCIKFEGFLDEEVKMKD